VIGIVTFALTLWYDNQDSFDSSIGISSATAEMIDRIIVIFITSSMTVIMLIVLIEAIFSCKRYASERSKTGVKEPRGLIDNVEEEQKQEGGNDK
jgi:heme/copper-type cytochrome/quinol oxidase subunit 2